MVWLHNVHGLPENVMGDVRRVMMNPLKYLHLEGEGEALEAMILFRNGRWSAGRGQEELFQLSGFLQLQYQTIYENSYLKVADLKFPYSKKVDREASPILIVE